MKNRKQKFKIFFRTKYGKIYKGNCVKVMKGMKNNSIDTIITDPPYGLEFMGKKWDKLWDQRANKPDKKGQKWSNKARTMPVYQAGIEAQQWHYKWAKEALRVAKPGSFMFVFGGTRVHHRMMCALEDAGWEIRDCISNWYDLDERLKIFTNSLSRDQRQAFEELFTPNTILGFLYGSGFPKSLNLSKMIDKSKKKRGKIIKKERSGKTAMLGKISKAKPLSGEYDITEPVTKEAKLWNGWGTALKPAWEPIVVVMKPIDSNFVNNALKHKVAGLNIKQGAIGNELIKTGGTWKNRKKETISPSQENYKGSERIGRWPSNIMFEHRSECVFKGFKKEKKSKYNDIGFEVEKIPKLFSEDDSEVTYGKELDDSFVGGFEIENWDCHPKCPVNLLNSRNKDYTISKLFFTSKASVSEKSSFNDHPTVKSLSVVEYLVKLTKMPKQTVVLDPFGGSGTTGLACERLKRKWIIIEKSRHNVNISKKRLILFKREKIDLADK